MGNSTLFSRIMEEYGSLHKVNVEEKVAKNDGAIPSDGDGPIKTSQVGLMQAEERLTGSVSFSVYAGYLRFAGGLVWAPIIVLLLTLSQASQGMPC